MTVSLKGPDLIKLAKILAKSNIAHPIRLKMILRHLDFDWIIYELDFNQSPDLLIDYMINRLGERGQEEDTHQESLGRFLAGIIEENIISDQQEKEDIRRIIREYEMLPSIPLTSAAPAPTTKTSEIEESKKLEAYTVNEKTSFDISTLSRAIQVSRSVCYIILPYGSGTGFLIGENIIITPNHVIPTIDELTGCRFRFNFQLGLNGVPEKYRDYKVKQDGVFFTNNKLDYTVVEADDSPGSEWGHLIYEKNSPSINDRINVVGHPMGGPKRISILSGFIQYIDNNILQYIAPTAPGSAGSPIFDGKWHIIAMHRLSGLITEPSTGRSYFRKEGTRISAIIDDLKVKLGEPGINKLII